MSTDAASGRTFRIRIQHSSTIKEGWRLSETTVEATFDAGDDRDEVTSDIRDWLDRAHMIGTIEANSRNGFAQPPGTPPVPVESASDVAVSDVPF